MYLKVIKDENKLKEYVEKSTDKVIILKKILYTIKKKTIIT